MIGITYFQTRQQLLSKINYNTEMNLLLARGIWIPYESISNYNMETATKAEAAIREEGNNL
jgi:hypothetical protein